MKLLFIFLIITSTLYSIEGCNVELDMDYRGLPNSNDISYQGVDNFQECCDLCTNDPTGQCKYWTFVYIKETANQPKSHVCWFKSSQGYKLSTLNRVSGSVNRTTTTWCASIESGYVYNNNDISQPLQNVPNYRDCCTRCSQTSGCVAWSYLLDYKYCYLKNALHTAANRRPYTNSFSGIISTTTVPTTSSVTCSVESNVAYQGNDISQPVTLPIGSSHGDCCTRCKQTTSCVAWSYFVDYRLCYLKNAPHTAANKVNFQNAFSSVSSSTGGSGDATCTITSGHIYPGADLSGSYLLNPTECCNQCAKTAGCVAWDYLNDSHYCFLKNALPSKDREVAYANTYSGIKK